MNSNTDPSSSPAMRVLTFGLFPLERIIHPLPSSARFPQYEPVPTKQWSNQGPALTMLKLLICRPGRRASKDVLIEGLWPGEKSETINVEHALHSAASALRQMVRTPEGSSLLETTRGSDGIGYKLPPQETLWVDADAFEDAVQQALDATQQGNDSLLWWENAYRLAKGIFLPDDCTASGRKRAGKLFEAMPIYVPINWRRSIMNRTGKAKPKLSCGRIGQRIPLMKIHSAFS